MLERIEKRIEFWSALGPFVILASLLIAIFRLSPHLFFIPVLSLIALPLCWKWNWKGFYLSVALLFIAALYILVEGSIHERVWGLSIAFVLLLGLFITSLSFSEVRKFTSFFKTDKEALLEENNALKDNLNALIREHRKEIDSLGLEIVERDKDHARVRLKLKVQEKDLLKLQEELSHKEHTWKETISSLNFEKEALQHTLQQDQARICELEALQNSLQLQKEKSLQEKTHELETLQNTLQQERENNLNALALLQARVKELEEMPSLPEITAEEIRVLKEKEALLKQLRAQFEEKNIVLAETRREVFQLQGDLFVMKRGEEEKNLSNDPYLNKLIRLIDIQEKEKSSLEKEIEALQVLISSLL